MKLTELKPIKIIMKLICIFFSFIFLFACKDISKSNNETEGNKDEVVNAIDTLKTLDEIKFALLDVRNEKAELLLGKPDIRGRIMMVHYYYTVYFNRINDKNEIKHLLILIKGNPGINEKSIIYKIKALRDGETANGVGNSFQNLTVSMDGLKSNSYDFISKDGSEASWDDFPY